MGGLGLPRASQRGRRRTARRTTLRELVQSRSSELLGAAVGPLDQFPLLVKFIDANQDLSVQVHPDDEQGRRLAGDHGKTEAWVILASKPGSWIYAGLKAGVTPSDLEAAIRSSNVEPLLHRFEARPGDSILIEAGTVHAIGSGVLLAEIQQMSDATFRIYDWNRVGPTAIPDNSTFARPWSRSTFIADRSIRSLPRKT